MRTKFTQTEQRCLAIAEQYRLLALMKTFFAENEAVVRSWSGFANFQWVRHPMLLLLQIILLPIEILWTIFFTPIGARINLAEKTRAFLAAMDDQQKHMPVSPPITADIASLWDIAGLTSGEREEEKVECLIRWVEVLFDEERAAKLHVQEALSEKHILHEATVKAMRSSGRFEQLPGPFEQLLIDVNRELGLYISEQSGEEPFVESDDEDSGRIKIIPSKPDGGETDNSLEFE